MAYFAPSHGMAVHLLLERWNIWVAWVVSGLSIYTAVQLLGFAKSLAKRPILVTDQQRLLHYGILNEAVLPLADLVRVDCSQQPLDQGPLVQKLTPLGEAESHNVVLHLRRPCEAVELYGRRRSFQTLGQHVDAPEAFKAPNLSD